MEQFRPFAMDTHDDSIKEQYRFARRPLYIEVRPVGGLPFRVLLGLHRKSKGIFNSLEWSAWWQKADSNRRKIVAEATRLRRAFIEPYLRDVATRDIPLIDALDEGDRADEDFRGISTTRFRDPIFRNAYHNVWIDHVLYSIPGGADPWVTNARAERDVARGRIWRVFPARLGPPARVCGAHGVAACCPTVRLLFIRVLLVPDRTVTLQTPVGDFASARLRARD